MGRVMLLSGLRIFFCGLPFSFHEPAGIMGATSFFGEWDTCPSVIGNEKIPSSCYPSSFRQLMREIIGETFYFILLF